MSALDRLILAPSEMASKIQSFDWSTNDLGTPETWSSTLINAIAVCLATPVPMQVWWGPTLTLFYNDAAAEGMEQQSAALGRRVSELWPERYRAIRSEIERVFESKRSTRTDTHTFVPLLEPSGEVGGIAVTTAHSLSLPSSELFALVGHELRNPLSAVATMSQALMMRGPTPELELLDRGVRQLTFILDELLESSRLARGKIQLQRKTVELAQIIDHALELTAAAIDSRHVRVAVSIPRVGWRIEADADRLARALASLLSSAVDSSLRGATITVDAVRAPDVTKLRIAGAGVVAQRRADLSRPVELEGTTDGLRLALSIARMTIELHGGSVTLHSSERSPGEYEIVLPSSAPVGRVPAGPPPASGRRRLLLVEDNDDAARALKTALEQLGYQVALAHDAPIALNLARTFQPDVALLDLGLPIMDGWELAKRLRSTNNELPIIAITARNEEADKQRSADLGFAEHLVKPVDLAHVNRLVQTLASRRGGDDASS